MKIKQVTEKTGLTEKAVRLYEQQGLIRPQKREVSGRAFREYDAATVQKLEQIAVLRRAGFSLAQIAALYEGRMDEVLPAYRQALQAELAQTRRVLACLAGGGYSGVPELAERLRAAVDALPMPEPELSFRDEPRPLPRRGLWVWNGLLPRRLQGGGLAVALLLRQKPMTFAALYALCRQQETPMDAARLQKLLARLVRWGVLRKEGETYTARCGALDRCEGLYTTAQLLDLVGLSQATAGGRAFYTSVPPMSTSSSAGTYAR